MLAVLALFGPLRRNAAVVNSFSLVTAASHAHPSLSPAQVEPGHDAHARAGLRRRDREVEWHVQAAGPHGHAGGGDEADAERRDVGPDPELGAGPGADPD